MRSARREAARGLLLLLIAFAVYAPIFGGGFLHDDDELVASNPVIQRGGRDFGPESWAGLRELWFPGPGSRNVFTLPGMFVPLDATARWLEWRMFGSDERGVASEARGIGAPGYHVVNVLLHAVCALILWRVLVQLAIPGAWFTALAWAVHPLCVESVAWIAEQRNTLAMACSLGSCAAWLRWCETRERRAWVASLIAFLFALLAKPAVVPLPFVLLLIGWWRRRPIGGEIRAALPFFGLSLAAGLLGAALQIELRDRQRAVSDRIARRADLPRELRDRLLCMGGDLSLPSHGDLSTLARDTALDGPDRTRAGSGDPARGELASA